jgi:hypothetical protein
MKEAATKIHNDFGCNNVLVSTLVEITHTTYYTTALTSTSFRARKSHLRTRTAADALSAPQSLHL